MESDSDVPVFKFKNEGLSDRCRDVFGCLDQLEEKHKVFEKTRSIEDAESDQTLIRQGPSVDESDQSKEEVFKHPGRACYGGRRGRGNMPLKHGLERSSHCGDPKLPNTSLRGQGTYRGRGRHGRGRSAPDYKTNPDKWTAYSLEDVDTSNSTMKRAAFDFLHEQRQRREGEQREDSVNVETVACSKGLISFKKPSKNKTGEIGKMNEKKAGQASHTVAMDEDVEDNDDIVSDPNIEMSDGSEADRGLNGNSREKRKLDSTDNVDNSEQMEEGNEQVDTGFKFRKVSRKNIRSRREKNDSDSD